MLLAVRIKTKLDRYRSLKPMIEQSSIGAVLFEDWDSEAPFSTHVTAFDALEAAKPFEYYKRALKCIVALLGEHALQPHTIIFYGNTDTGKFGRMLFNQLQGRAKIIEVSKSYGSPLKRGSNGGTIGVRATGLRQEDAELNISKMSGSQGVPKMLSLAASLAHQGLQSAVLRAKQNPDLS